MPHPDVEFLCNDNKESEPSSKEEHGVPNDYASFVIDYMKQAGRDVKMSEISSLYITFFYYLCIEIQHLGVE